MSRILLINPSYFGSYASSQGRLINPIMPTLGLATIAAEAVRRGHRVTILDLSHRRYDWRSIRQEILGLKPDVVGITATTPLMNQLRDISLLCKDISEDMRVVGGGAHASALPHESLMESRLDAVLPGEADLAFAEVCDGRSLDAVPGAFTRSGSGSRQLAPTPLLQNLDSLPMPAWRLYSPAAYRDKVSRLLCSAPPLTMAEFSRGCVFQCDFCASKNSMGLGYRKKSPRRCAEELRLLRRLGWRECMLADDIFTSDKAWATSVCEEIIRAGSPLAWQCDIRVESADEGLFRLMRRAGCYRVYFGFESGNDVVLKRFGKGGRASVELGRKAVETARRAGMEVNGYFLLGLSPDTIETMRETIDYALSLRLDTLRFGMTIAFPGTPMFRRYLQEGLLRTFDWDRYYVYTSDPPFFHPRLEPGAVARLMRQAYLKTVFLNPSFFIRRLRRGIATGEIFRDALYFAKFLLSAASRGETACEYYARERWPCFDFKAYGCRDFPYQMVRAGTVLRPG